MTKKLGSLVSFWWLNFNGSERESHLVIRNGFSLGQKDP